MAAVQQQQAASPAVQQAAQASLAVALAREVAAAWRATLNVAQLGSTLPDLSAVLAALVQQYGSASAAMAAEYYAAARAAAGVGGLFVPVPASPPDLGQVTAGVKWATKDLWTATPDPGPALKLTQAAAEALVLGTGRDTITNAVAGDRKARGWARHTEPGACSFCLLLATRGAAYKSRQTAAFEAHNNCRCQPEPVFGAYEPPAEIRHWQAVYRQAAKAGSGKAVRDEFRRLVDAHRAPQGPAQGEVTPHGG